MANNNLKETIYEYSINMAFILNGKENGIDSETIKNVVIQNDYESSFAPIMYANINLPISMYNTMQKERDKGKMLVQIDMMVRGSKSRSTYLKKQLSYFFPSDDYDFTTNKLSKSTEADTSKSYRSVYIGFLDTDILNDNNKKIMNNLFKSITHKTILEIYMGHIPIVMEPFDNNPTHSIFYLPPMTGIISFLTFMNENGSFFNSGYRYYRDFNRAYLLSNKGIATNIKEGIYDVVNIEVEEGIETDAPFIEGQVNDGKNKCHIISLNTNEYSINIDKISDKVINEYISINYMGSSNKININNNKGIDTRPKPTIYKYFNGNSNYAKSIAGKYATNDTTFTFQKEGINGNIICPHKKFMIKNESAYKSKDGAYLLASKTETFAKYNGDIMRMTLSATFKKVNLIK